MNNAVYPWMLDLYCTDLEGIDTFYRNKPASQPLLAWSLEYIEPQVLIKKLDHLRSLDTQQQDRCLVHRSFRYDMSLFAAWQDRIHEVDFDLHVLGLHMHRWRFQRFNPVWNSDTGRFLLLLGQPYYASRLRLLWHLDQAHLLANCEWSMNSTVPRQWGRELLPELTEEQYHAWIDLHQRDPDGAFTDLSGGMAREGDIFDWHLYRDTSFRVVCETNERHRPIITEKTWITIANRHPFLIVTQQPGVLQHLDDLGFRTFREYLPRPDYDSVQDLESRLKAVVENIRWLCSNISDMATAIHQDIEHNFALLETLIAQEWRIIQHEHAQLDTPVPAHRLIPLYKQRYAWWLFYYAVRDPSWPDCDDEHQFADLPLGIQQELCDRGYRPRYPKGIA